jgi:L-amino acid N-acyltransferase YncA
MTTIRLATEADAEAIQAIYAPYVQHTPISFELEPPSVEEMRERIRKTLALFPWLVCGNGQGRVVGYAYASRHRERAAYQWSVDAAVYVDPRAHRTGIGRGLYTSLFALLRLQGFFNVYAGIALPNEASVSLHTAVGFQPVGVYRAVGYKLGKWHDVSWWSLALQPSAAEPSPPRPLDGISQDSGWQTALNAGLSLVRPIGD